MLYLATTSRKTMVYRYSAGILKQLHRAKADGANRENHQSECIFPMPLRRPATDGTPEIRYMTDCKSERQHSVLP